MPTTPEKEMPGETPDGRVIVARQPAYITEAFGKPVANPKPAKGINQLLLEDESTIFECAEGDYVNADVQFVVRHRTKHSENKRRYPPDVLAKVMQYWYAERQVSVRGVNERTAIRLNADKVPTPTGMQWFASTVASLTSTHKAEYPEGEVQGQDATPDPAKPILAPPDAMTAAFAAGQIRSLVDWLLSAVEESAGNCCQHDDYDDLKEKAETFDQLQTLLQKGK